MQECVSVFEGVRECVRKKERKRERKCVCVCDRESIFVFHELITLITRVSDPLMFIMRVSSNHVINVTFCD